MASRQISITIGEAPAPRFDKALAQFVPEEVSLSRSRLQKLIEAGGVRDAEGRVIDAVKHAVAEGEIYFVHYEEAQEITHIEPEDLALEILYEDADLIVVNKPAGMVVHPAPGSPNGTLVNGLVHQFGDGLSSTGGVSRPGIVHRIDKDTSGLIVVAKTDAAHTGLADQFRAHSIKRSYLALTKSVPDRGNPQLQGLPGVKFEDGGIIRVATFIERHKNDRKRMTVTKQSGRHAITRFRVIEEFGYAALVECRLETGRTHQIRVHMAHLGHGLIGDPVYGRKRSLPELEGLETARQFQRQALHAQELGFCHPISGQDLEFRADPPEDFKNLLQSLRQFA